MGRKGPRKETEVKEPTQELMALCVAETYAHGLLWKPGMKVPVKRFLPKGFILESEAESQPVPVQEDTDELDDDL